MERILHFVGTGPHPDSRELQIIEIAKALHPTWEIKVWKDPVESEGFLLTKYHKSARSGAQLSDLIRLDVVYRCGGIYLDSDVRLVKPLDDLCRYDNFFCSEDGYQLTNAVFGASKQSPVIGALIEKLLAEEPEWSETPNVTTGPVFFARVLQWRKDTVLLPRETFYPYNFNEPPCPPLKATIGVHEWAGSWLPRGLMKQLLRKPSRPTGVSAIKESVKKIIRQVAAKTTPIVVAEYEKLGHFPGTSYSFGTDLIAKTSRGLMMSLPGADLSITPEIALSATYEEPELRFIEKTLRGGDFFVDVGCNVGVFTLLAARAVGPFGRVFAFDPNDEVIKHLRRSLVMNWVHDRVKIFDCAVGELEEMVTLRYSRLRLGDGNLGQDDNSTFNRSVAELGDLIEKQTRAVTLDHVFPHSIEIKILKIDVEGFEHAVFGGSRRLLKERSINYLMVELLEEVAPRSHQQNIDAIREAMDLGYRICRIDAGGNLIRCESIRDATTFSRNLILERE